MNKKHYNNVIDWTLKHDKAAQTEDSLATARAVFNNMGVALPNGSMQDVYDTIKTNKYMGWRACTMQEAQEAANKGTAAIGISKDRVVILSAADEEEPVVETASVMTLSEKTSAFAVTNLEYYTYSCSTTCQNCGTDIETGAHNLLYGIPKDEIEDYFILSGNVDISSVDYRLIFRLYIMGNDLGFDNIRIDSGYRSYDQQEALYEAYKRDPENNPEAAPPGESWHNWGGAVDLRSGALTALLDSEFECYDLIRPVEGEPWHIQVSETRNFSRDERDDYFDVITKWSEVIC